MFLLRLFAWIALFSVFCLSVIFTIPNTHPVTLNYYFNSLQVNLSILLLIVLIFGIILGSIFNGLWVWHLQRQNQYLKKLYQQSQHEINVLQARLHQDTTLQ